MRREPDLWAKWLQHKRHGGDPEQHRVVLNALEPVRDRVIENARINAGDTVLDVGCGDGLIGFAAATRVGGAGRVILSDVSEDLLSWCRSFAEQVGLRDRLSFLKAGAEDLTAVEASSVDAVTVRSVLIYVQDRAAAFGEFFRVLRPGGRLSLFEPINRYAMPGSEASFFGYEVGPVSELASRVAHTLSEKSSKATTTMSSLTEQELLGRAWDAGFRNLHLELRVHILPPRSGQGRTWQSFLGFAPNPLAPTVGEAITTALSPADAARFAEHLRPQVENLRAAERHATAFLWCER